MRRLRDSQGKSASALGKSGLTKSAKCRGVFASVLQPLAVIIRVHVCPDFRSAIRGPITIGNRSVRSGWADSNELAKAAQRPPPRAEPNDSFGQPAEGPAVEFAPPQRPARRLLSGTTSYKLVWPRSTYMPSHVGATSTRSSTVWSTPIHVWTAQGPEVGRRCGRLLRGATRPCVRLCSTRARVPMPRTGAVLRHWWWRRGAVVLEPSRHLFLGAMHLRRRSRPHHSRVTTTSSSSYYGRERCRPQRL